MFAYETFSRSNLDIQWLHSPFLPFLPVRLAGAIPDSILVTPVEAPRSGRRSHPRRPQSRRRGLRIWSLRWHGRRPHQRRAPSRRRAAEPTPGGPVAAPYFGRIRGEPAPGDRGERRRGGAGEPAPGGLMVALPSAIRPCLFFFFFFLIGISFV